MRKQPKHLQRRPAGLAKNLFVRLDSEVEEIVRDIATVQDRPLTRVVRELVRESLASRGLLKSA